MPKKFFDLKYILKPWHLTKQNNQQRAQVQFKQKQV